MAERDMVVKLSGGDTYFALGVDELLGPSEERALLLAHALGRLLGRVVVVCEYDEVGDPLPAAPVALQKEATRLLKRLLRAEEEN